MDFLISLSFDAKIHYNKHDYVAKKLLIIKVQLSNIRLASFRHAEGCHLPIKGIGWLSTTRFIEYLFIKAEKDSVGLKPYHVDNNAS